MKAPVAAGLAVGIAFVVLFSTIKLPSGVGNVDGAVITMERTMCFGTCPAHSLAIHANGTVNYEGFDCGFVAKGKTEDEIANTDRWIKGANVMPVDFEVAYSYGVGLQYTLDTRAETFSTQMCNNFAAQHTALALSEQEMWHIWQSVEENDFFYAARLYRGCPDFGPCTLIEPEDLSTLQVFANEQTHGVEFRQNYELNHGAPAGSNFYKSKSVVKTIESVLSQYNNNHLPETKCRYARNNNDNKKKAMEGSLPSFVSSSRSA